MSVLEELEQAVRQVAERVGPSVVGIGRGPGARVRGRAGRRAGGHQRPQHPRRGDDRRVRRRPQRRRAGGRGRRRRRPGRDRGRHRWGAGHRLGHRCRGHGRVGGVRPGQPGRAAAGHLRAGLGGRPRLPRAAGPADRRQHRAHRPPAPGRLGRPGGRRRRVACSASTPTGWATASTWPCRPTPSCASGWTPSAAARPRRGPGSASASPPPGWPGSCAAPSACPSGTACWSGWSRTAARPTGPGCAPATWWSRPAAGRSPTPTSSTRSSTRSARTRPSPSAWSAAPTS